MHFLINMSHRMFSNTKSCLFVLCCLPVILSAQRKTPIVLDNPSFEDNPQESKTPIKWFECRTKQETPPDIQPGYHGVKTPPSHGRSYLGLVVRDNETNEGVSQRLKSPMAQGQCYDFSIDVCQSILYLSLSPTIDKTVKFATPAKLRVWGGNGFNDRKELLAETEPIKNKEWLTKNLRLDPKNGSYNFIILEAYYKTPIVKLYNGHILIDNASDIRPAGCENPPAPPATPAVIASVGKTKKNVAKEGVKSKPEPVKPLTTATAPTNTVASNNKIDRNSLRKGSIIQLDYVYFDANRHDIKPETEPALKWLANFLRLNPDIVIEVGGHTNNNPSDSYAIELSTNRARAVAEWLVKHGSPATQVQHKGYGKSRPLVPNTDADGRRKNQRVEITILNIGT
jgi:outer membrane protein OmpA-like peptidoglycan-associated protein